MGEQPLIVETNVDEKQPPLDLRAINLADYIVHSITTGRNLERIADAVQKPFPASLPGSRKSKWTRSLLRMRL